MSSLTPIDLVAFPRTHARSSRSYIRKLLSFIKSIIRPSRTCHLCPFHLTFTDESPLNQDPSKETIFVVRPRARSRRDTIFSRISGGQSFPVALSFSSMRACKRLYYYERSHYRMQDKSLISIRRVGTINGRHEGAPFLSNKNKEKKNSRCAAGQASCVIGIDRDLSRIEIHTRLLFFYRLPERGSITPTVW